MPLQASGRAASSTNPATWTSYAKANASKTGVGLGFVMDGSGIACIDLDHCLDGGKIAPWAQEILSSLPATYIEVSPSGTGLHVWGLGTVGRGRKVRRGPVCIEAYDRGRYVTVTGVPWDGAPAKLGDLTPVIVSI